MKIYLFFKKKFLLFLCVASKNSLLVGKFQLEYDQEYFKAPLE